MPDHLSFSVRQPQRPIRDRYRPILYILGVFLLFYLAFALLTWIAP